MKRAIIVNVDVESEEDLQLLVGEITDALASLPVISVAPWASQNPLRPMPPAAPGLLPPA